MIEDVGAEKKGRAERIRMPRTLAQWFAIVALTAVGLAVLIPVVRSQPRPNAPVPILRAVPIPLAIAQPGPDDRIVSLPAEGIDDGLLVDARPNIDPGMIVQPEQLGADRGVWPKPTPLHGALPPVRPSYRLVPSTPGPAPHR